MEQFELEESPSGAIYICDHSEDAHKRFCTPNCDGREFTEQLKKAKNVTVTFEGSKYTCPCCGGCRT